MKKTTMRVKLISTILALLVIYSNSSAQSAYINPEVKTSKSIVDEFMDLRFGLFIHWGPVTLRGTEIGWSRTTQVETEDYDSLYKEFNPILFDADEWVKTAHDAGMKYLTITAKHHDGFCLWPTQYSDYNIMNSAYKKDIIGELNEACKKYNIKFCVYFSVLDWHDEHYPHYTNKSEELKPTADMDKFVSTMKNQLSEIIKNYNPYMLWFDGNWEKSWKNEYAVDIYNHIKKIDSDVIINNRLGFGDGKDHPTLNAETVGDYATPEQKIGELNMDIPWETCMTIAQQWSWKPNDKVKPLQQCIQTLVRSAGGNGNLLFNIGPMLDGRIEQRQVSILNEMGDWLRINGESIYETKGGPFAPNDVFATTRKGNKLYVHIFENVEKITLPQLKDIKIKNAYFMQNQEKVVFEKDKSGTLILSLPEALPDNMASVIVLELKSNAENIPIIMSDANFKN